MVVAEDFPRYVIKMTDADDIWGIKNVTQAKKIVTCYITQSPRHQQAGSRATKRVAIKRK